MEENDDVEEPTEGKGGRPGVFDKARGVVGAAQRQVSRSAEVLSGSDIRRFDDFTDAATRAVVGVHRDQAELREHLERTDQTVDDVRQRQARLAERFEHLEQSVDRVLRGQEALSARVEQSTHSHTAPEGSGGVALAPWIVAVVASAAALLLSIAAIVVSMS